MSDKYETVKLDRYQIRINFGIKFLLCEKEVYLAFKICICYNAARQRNVEKSM